MANLLAPLVFFTRVVGWVLVLATLSSCHGGYTYTFNDNVVYSPEAKGRSIDGTLRDDALQGCLNQILALNAQLLPAQVKLLACPGSGVESLAGIGALVALEQLELSDNRIVDLRPLGQLRNLRVLGLRNNPVTTVTPLLDLPLLRFVSLVGNNQLACAELAAMRTKIGNTLNSPLQCKE